MMTLVGGHHQSLQGAFLLRLKRIGSILLTMLALYVIVGVGLVTKCCGRSVCVRPTFPFGKEAPTQMVLAELAKHNIQAQVCTDKEQAIELYFYPLNISQDSEQTFFYISALPTSTGVVGDISTSKPHWNDQVWVVSVHPWGDEESIKRQMGFSLKSQIGKVAKWIGKNFKG